MRPSATPNRDSLGLREGLRSPAPTLTLYLCKELFVVLLGGQAGRGWQASLFCNGRHYREGGLAISISGLLHICAVLWVLSLCGGDNRPLCPEITFLHPGPSAPEAPPKPLTSRPKPHVPCPGTASPKKSSRGHPTPLDQIPVAPPTSLPLCEHQEQRACHNPSLPPEWLLRQSAPAHLALFHLASESQIF